MFPDQDVNSGSLTLVEAHSRNWPNKRILMQVVCYKLKLGEFKLHALLDLHTLDVKLVFDIKPW